MTTTETQEPVDAILFERKERGGDDEADQLLGEAKAETYFSRQRENAGE